MKKRVVVTGVGAISALGDDPATLHQALCLGGSAIGPITRFDWQNLPAAWGAEIKDFDAKRYLGEVNLRPLDRTSQFAVSGAQRALESSGWTTEMREVAEMELALGTMFCSVRTNTQFDRAALISGPKHIKPLDFANTVINSATGQTAIWHHLRGASMTVSAGATSGVQAIQYAARRVALGWSRAVLVGGVEELCFETWYAFAQSGHLADSGGNGGSTPFSRGRTGFFPGEGSGYLVLEDSDAATARGATVLAEITGYGSSYDPTRGANEDSAVAAGVRAIKTALETAAIAPEIIGCISASGNGSAAGDRVEACALREIFGARLALIPAFALAAALGETFGASGLLQTIALIESARRGQITPTHGVEDYDETLPTLALSGSLRNASFEHGLVMSNGFDGSTAAVIIAVSTKTQSNG
jgi:3-oxoacyl-[acyl-carrier-protein] synthase II